MQYRAMYRSALRQLDTDLLALRSMLAEQRLLGRTTIVLVGGYGLSFGESGLFPAERFGVGGRSAGAADPATRSRPGGAGGAPPGYPQVSLVGRVPT
ncbi:MAG: hypothetical protein R3E96_07700 [Planctomycetota bacterium]